MTIRCVLVPLALTLTAALPAQAETLQVTGTLVFESHERVVAPDFGGIATKYKDTYSIQISDLVVPTADYDRIEITIDAGPGMRLVVDPLLNDMSMRIDVEWGTGDGYQGFDIAPAYTGGAGNLPPPDTGTIHGFGINRTGFALKYGVSSISSDFSFDSMTFSRTIDPAETQGGAYSPLVNDVFLSYGLNGTGPVTGPFSRIVPEPTSLALLGLGGLLIARRRRSKPVIQRHKEKR